MTMPNPLTLSTPDPRFDPHGEILVNGYRFVRAGDDRASIHAYLKAEAHNRRASRIERRVLNIVADGVAAKLDREGSE